MFITATIIMNLATTGSREILVLILGEFGCVKKSRNLTLNIMSITQDMAYLQYVCSDAILKKAICGAINGNELF